MTHPTEQPDGAHGECATEDLVKSLRVLEEDHEPDGWPAIRMNDISALLDRIEQQAARIKCLEKEVQTEQRLSFRAQVAELESRVSELSAALDGARSDGKAHEIWSASQLAPGEGIEDGVARIKHILSRLTDVSEHVAAIEAQGIRWAAAELGSYDRCQCYEELLKLAIRKLHKD